MADKIVRLNQTKFEAFLKEHGAKLRAISDKGERDTKYFVTLGRQSGIHLAKSFLAECIEDD